MDHFGHGQAGHTEAIGEGFLRHAQMRQHILAQAPIAGHCRAMPRLARAELLAVFEGCVEQIGALVNIGIGVDQPIEPR